MPIVDSNALAKFYRCTQNAPLGCQKPIETAEKIPGAKFCLECGFPTTLPIQTELRGSLGTYRISEILRSQGMGRLYRGTQISNGQSVVVKEYLLPKQYFNAVEAQQRRTALSQVAKGNLTTPKGREFRLVSPSEIIADPLSDRVYLIFSGEIAALPTLKQTLTETGAFSASQVRQVLNQMLQSLHFLHSQPSSFASVAIGTAHGNLGLDSLLISDSGYVYVCDLASWEQLFIPAPRQMLLPEQDLIDLGSVAFALWTAQEIHSGFNAPLNPREAQHWPQNDPPLRDFLHRLLGLDTPFNSAAEARQALIKLPQPETADGFHGNFSPESPAKPNRKYWLLSLLALPLLGGLLWLLLPRSISNSNAEMANFKQLLPSFADVNGIQPGQYPYTGEALGTWTIVLDKKPASDRKLRVFLTQPKLDIAAIFNYRTYAPQRSPLNEVLEANTKANFAIASLSTQLPEGLIQETIAYDGLLVYVPAYKSQNLPSALQGKISLAQLQQIFTGQLTNWKQLGSDFPDLPIKPYRPMEPEALRLFQQKVLGNDPSLIAQFSKIEQRSTFNTLRSIAVGEKQAQKTEAGSISFGLLTQTWDQCKIYPLAIAQKNLDPVQPLLKETSNGVMQPISPSDNLCLEKKPLLNISAFHTATYPLSTPLIIAYPRDNNLPGNVSGPLFANFLKTQDGQYLLQQAGLVPLQTPPKNYTLSSSILNR
ncbi:substrate-binding domain-containing protein [Nostoc sp. ChiVER01]|uniref:substrate-binding domain-containing protein n=1 Tax=Nostoc sp. ChiVER01 TaxID=3075382 RepID=UPI002AD5641C|nr:substrate-binding domain-containing protein [Nostoc sp. ChiVER01]MDZ8221752.1 substrate-binding domain-containing protein [Nostoc sp. ChiVER01]